MTNLEDTVTEIIVNEAVKTLAKVHKTTVEMVKTALLAGQEKVTEEFNQLLVKGLMTADEFLAGK